MQITDSIAKTAFGWIAVLGMLAAGCGKPRQQEESKVAVGDKYFLKRVVSAENRQKVELFCGDCHEMPKASSFPIDAWRHEVDRGFEFYDQSGRTDLERPNLYDTIAYFTQEAPSREAFMKSVKATEGSEKLGPKFELVLFDSLRSATGVANIEFGKFETPGFVACDMKDGNAYLHQVQDPQQSQVIMSGKAPINSTVCDLDQDGQQDIMISDIGDYKATDAELGKIVWLKRSGKEFSEIEIAAGLGRICQTVVQDFDGDQDNDILVAEFGYFKTGSIYLLENDGQGFTAQNFTKSMIDSRHGTVRLMPHDFDGDGDLDFATVIAQEFESVEIFINDGQANFQSKSIYAAGYPSYGSSGLTLVDLDQDGDTDILYTNGDTFDSMLPKPYHSIQWLENLGELNFKHHHITNMPGVHCAHAADFDGDGDQDIVASAFMSKFEGDFVFDSIIYLENDGQNQFKKYWIERDELFYPSLQIGDFNSDGKMDFVVGTAAIATKKKNLMPVRIYLNRHK